MEYVGGGSALDLVCIVQYYSYRTIILVPFRIPYSWYISRVLAFAFLLINKHIPRILIYAACMRQKAVVHEKPF